MANLTMASRELFERSPDERFESLHDLYQHCLKQKERSRDIWQPPEAFAPCVEGDTLTLGLGDDGSFHLNHWAFSQLCRLCGVARDTIVRLSPETASRAIQETMPAGKKPLQVLTGDHLMRSIHGIAYSRLWNIELVSMLREFATDFEPPPKGAGGATGLYCGEEDMFCFLIDPAGWIEIADQPFAPGFFVWNSEVGRRSVGVQTFWFQAVCQNHIVWDAVEVVEFTRKHTGNVAESLITIRQIIEKLVAKRDARKDEFAKVVAKAMREKVGADGDEAMTFLYKHGISRSMVKKAVAMIAAQGGPFSLWSLVDALTQLTREIRFAGDRMEADEKVSKLLSLAP